MKRKHRKHNSIGMAIMLYLLNRYALELTDRDFESMDDESLWEIEATATSVLAGRRKARMRKEGAVSWIF